MNCLKTCGALLLMAWGINACIEPYDPPLADVDVNLLVVDGYLDIQSDLAVVKLSRSLPVNSTDAFPFEANAFVRIENGDGLFYPLAETANGVYTGTVQNAGSGQTYRLLIRTGDKREYSSDFVNVVDTPPIDSVTWSADADGVEFSVTTHDPANEVKHFRWKYQETYEYNATYNSLYKLSGSDIVARSPGESIFTCWRTNQSTDIIVASARRLEQSLISRFPITVIPIESIKISVKYSLLVQQEALTEEAFEYWSNLEKTTEHLGGLFDPLPSEVRGNIHSISNPAETALGFFSAGSVQQARIFLRRRQLPAELRRGFSMDLGCAMDTVMLWELADLHSETLILDAIYAPGAGLVGYTTTGLVSCADCTKFGGTTTKPTFWE